MPNLIRSMRSGALAAAAAALVACASTPEATQAPAPVATAQEPVRPPGGPSAAAKTPATPASSPAPEAPTPTGTVAEKPIVLTKPDTYTVRPGDTLALISRRPEIYGDAAMWMLLYRANAGQIASVDWLCPGQVLVVPRNYTEADARMVRDEARRRAPWPPGAKTMPTAYLCKGMQGVPAAKAPRAKEGPKPATAAEAKRASGPAKAVARAGSQPVPAASASTSGATGGADTAATGLPASASPVTVGTSRNAFREAARRAYNVGDIAWARYYYRKHLAMNPRDSDALGELGNIYYQSGDLANAARLYYDAARVLIERGNRARASQLLLAVSEGNPALADDLYARLVAPSAP